MELTICPECGTVAEVLWRTALDSTSGPVEHAKVLCLNRHGFLLPVESLTLIDSTTHSTTYSTTHSTTHSTTDATPQPTPAQVQLAPLANSGADDRGE